MGCFTTFFFVVAIIWHFPLAVRRCTGAGQPHLHSTVRSCSPFICDSLNWFRRLKFHTAEGGVVVLVACEFGVDWMINTGDTGIRTELNDRLALPSARRRAAEKSF